MIYRHVKNFLHGAKYHRIPKRHGAVHLHLMLCHCYSTESQEEALSFKWYEKAYPTITKLTHQLQSVDSIDGKLVNVNDGSIIIDDRIAHKMLTLKSLVRVFIGSPVVQRNLRESIKDLSANLKCKPVAFFSKSSEREPMIVNSLTKISNFLNVSAQQRKVVRHTICPQVTQHRIWKGALEEILNDLKLEMDSLCYEYSGKGNNMGQQIVSSCLKFLADADNSDHDCTSWMKIGTSKGVDSFGSGTWEDLLEMFSDLIGCLQSQNGLLCHVAKLEVMKEGLYQIKDVLVDKGIGYKEVRHQENLVRKKLSKTLGHSSRCLFTLLSYYLYGYVRDMEVDICGGIYVGDNGTRFCLYMGRILTSDEEKIVRSGVKQLDRALGLFKFVWDAAGMQGVLELQGHLWCVGAKNRMLTYRGTLFFVHGFGL
ncbi:uncharacterized protein LOC8259483 [Ricinus communis]|uniref:uncharacterized protein LOC8259483 n=1 Tax=Ricinus communis TaxID=3988 RepID=UPI00201A7C40|nr:uncharacterized protein LOC8259483 [Ricinus communis]